MYLWQDTKCAHLDSEAFALPLCRRNLQWMAVTSLFLTNFFVASKYLFLKVKRAFLSFLFFYCFKFWLILSRFPLPTYEQFQMEHNIPDQTFSKQFIGSAACWSRGQCARYVLNNPWVSNKPCPDPCAVWPEKIAKIL